ncbi:TDT family transporter [Corallincola platygyrae]|uniref:TDT family transporter n=1 Tax=Corallincola platygyrae TaxID=1193278 RepID=A0ABW4XNI4_9GAMM
MKANNPTTLSEKLLTGASATSRNGIRKWSGWQTLANVPAPTGGLALACFSLASALVLFAGLNASYAGALEFLAGVFLTMATVWLVPVVVKYLVHSRLLKSELAHPVVGSVLPTTSMALMVATSWLVKSEFVALQMVAETVWVAAVALHLLLLLGFASKQSRGFTLNKVVPSWFVPPIGIVAACVTAPAFGLELLTQPLFWFGLLFYAIQLPVVMYRLLFAEKIPESALCTLAIMGAPPSLLLAGYLSAFAQPEPVLVLLLAPLALLMTGLVYLALLKLLRLSFSPGYAAMTFPLVIGATAQLLLSEWAVAQQMSMLADVAAIAGKFELSVAFVIVSYVCAHYLCAFMRAMKKAA